MGPGSTNGGITVCGQGVTRTVTSPTGTFGIPGNVTVCNHATLTILNVVATIQSHTATNSPLLTGDLNYRYHVNVTGGGSLHLVNSTLNTSASSFYAYPFLNVTVANGSFLYLDKSSLAFAGSVWVTNHSSLFLNSSSVTANSAASWGPSTVVADSAYAPTLTVTKTSTLVSTRSTITKYYKNAASDTNALDETFGNTPNAALANGTNYGGFQPPNSAVLVSYTHNNWASATLNLTVSSTRAFTAVVNLNAYGATTPVTPSPASFGIGVHNVTVAIPSAFVYSTLNPHGLYGLLGGMQAGSISIDFTGISGSGAAPTLVSSVLSLTPIFDFNVTIASGSQIFAVDSRYDVNWANATCGNPSYQSNKVSIETGSLGDFLNTTAATLSPGWTQVCSPVNAFLVDQYSQYVVYDWARFTAVGSGGSPVPGAHMYVVSNISDPVLAGQATSASNPANWNGILSFFRTAVEAVAVPAGSPYPYGDTASTGVALYALAASFVTYGSQPDGLYVDMYNVSFNETVGTVGPGGGSTVVPTGVAIDTPRLCSWPYWSLGCGLTIIPSVVLPLFTADMRVTGLSVATPPANPCNNGCSIYEGTKLLVSVTITDANGFTVAGGASIPVYVYNVTSSLNATPSVQWLDNGMFSSSKSIVLSFVLSVPFHISQPPTPHLWVSIDPLHVAPENGTVQKNATFDYVAIPAPHVGAPTILVNDGCTGQPLAVPDSNSCSRVTFLALLSNTGDAKVNVSVTFLWNGMQIGGIHSLTLQVGAPVTISESLLVTYNYTSGVVSVDVTSNSGTPIDVSASTPELYFTAFTTLSLVKMPCAEGIQCLVNTSLVVPGGSGPVPVNSSTTKFAVGDAIGVTLTLNNLGEAGTNARATLSILRTGSSGAGWAPLTNYSLGTIPAATTQAATDAFTMYWHINDATIGSDVGQRIFNVSVTYNDSWLYGETTYTFGTSFSVTIAPPVVTIPSFGFSSTTITVGTPEALVPTGTLYFEATPTQTAQVTEYLIGTSNGNLCIAFQGPASNNTTPLPGFTAGLTPNPNDPNDLATCLGTGTYVLHLKVSYLGESAWFNSTGQLTLKTAKTSSSLLGSAFFLILLAIIAVVIVVAVLFLLRKFGKGNLVECGECGELIPETAAACPKCGAEFEKGMVRCSRCASSIPANSKSCPECSVLLVGHEADPQAVAYTKFADRYRALGKKELGENYSEGAFWDWWKRQPTYLSFSAWSQQQQPAIRGSAPGEVPTAQQMTGMSRAAPSPAEGTQTSPQGQAGQRFPPQPTPPVEEPSGGPSNMMKVCPSCGKGIHESFLLCPFCGAVTR